MVNGIIRKLNKISNYDEKSKGSSLSSSNKRNMPKVWEWRRQKMH